MTKLFIYRGLTVVTSLPQVLISWTFVSFYSNYFDNTSADSNFHSPKFSAVH